ncbi:hypothetical protein C8Q70DRAFT_928904, partial [Cubamyces menziesii]
LLVYEYVITFGQEVRYVWAQKKTGAAMLFLMIRYASLAEGVMEIFILLPIAGKLILIIPSCTIPSDGLTRPHIVFSALRTLALSDMNRALAIVTFVLACGPVIINLVRVALSPHKSA